MGKTVALIPARGGSKRVPGKNTRLLQGNPLICYTVSAAIESSEFDHVLVSSDDFTTLEIARSCGADVLKRPPELATDTSPDIDWVAHALVALSNLGNFTTFSILRPTSPFRTATTIRRAFQRWRKTENDAFTSLRAVEPASQHPGKMWQVRGKSMSPLLMQPVTQPWHDSQYASLPPVYVQNASLEIAHTRTVAETGTISGRRVLPFLTEGFEGFDINSKHDWAMAELLISRGEARLPELKCG